VKLRALAARALLVLVMLPAVAASTVTVVDDEGATVTLPRPATRIVSLAPHLTEQLFAVGAGGSIVGTTEFADFPTAALQIPRVARAHGVDLERIAALKPDLVVIWGSGFPPATTASVRRLGVPVFVSEPQTLDDVASSLRRLGALAGTSGEAAADAFGARVAALRARYAGKPAVRVFYQVWATPLMTLGGRHVISEAIALCGGHNVFADLTPIAPQVSIEAVLAADPQVVVTAEPGARPGTALTMWQQFPNLSATRAGQFYTLDADRMNRHGPRLVDEVAVLCAALDQARAGTKK
jgi:iron complex transport system substrate-binding protein